MSKFNDDRYTIFIKKRLDFLEEYFTKDYFKNKSILEIGAAEGHIGNQLQEWGAQVVCSEGRVENIKRGENLFPNLKFINEVIDKNYIPNKNYDIIINFGLLYHLDFENQEDFIYFFKKLREKCSLMILETIIDNSVDIKTVEENSTDIDQSIKGLGNRTSEFLIEKILKKAGFSFKVIKMKSLNHLTRVYNFKKGELTPFNKEYRRMWVCK